MTDMRSPRFHEKFSNLLRIKGLSQAKFAELISDPERPVTQTAIHRYASGSTPPPHVVIRIAEVLDVDPVWLSDERQAWIDPPPPYGHVTMDNVDDDALADEVRSRIKGSLEKIQALVEEAKKIDWGALAKELERRSPFDEDLPADLKQNLDIYDAMKNALMAVHRLRDRVDFGLAVIDAELAFEQVTEGVKSTEHSKNFLAAWRRKEASPADRRPLMSEVERLTADLKRNTSSS